MKFNETTQTYEKLPTVIKNRKTVLTHNTSNTIIAHLNDVQTLRQSGNSSAGRARPCQGRGREFESRFPLQIHKAPILFKVVSEP